MSHYILFIENKIDQQNSPIGLIIWTKADRKVEKLGLGLGLGLIHYCYHHH
jgi:hypothetical protein